MAEAAAPGSAPRIVVTRRLPDPVLDRLAADGDLWVSPYDRALGRAELLEAVPGAAALVTMGGDRVDEAVLEAAGPTLRVVANYAVGYDNFDLDALARHGVVATNTPGVLTEATADLAFALMLAVMRRVGEGERLIRTGREWSWSPLFLVGADVHASTIGIVGLGAIGRAMARRARGFGMRVLYSGRRGAGPDVERALDAHRLPLEELLARADVVSLHCPLTPETHHLIDAAALAAMRPGAYLVNTTRGPVVDEAALAQALRARTIAGAALDVFEEEPRVHPALLELENVVLCPHLGSATTATRVAMGLLAADNVVAVLRGEPPPTPILR